MAKLAKMTWEENRMVILNLIDMGFTAGAVAYMTNTTKPNIYFHLKHLKRTRDRTVIRRTPKVIHPAALQLAAKVVTTTPWKKNMASAIQRGSREYGKKRA